MNGVDKVIASAIAMTHLSFSLGTFQIQLQVTDLIYYFSKKRKLHAIKFNSIAHKT